MRSRLEEQERLTNEPATECETAVAQPKPTPPRSPLDKLRRAEYFIALGLMLLVLLLHWRCSEYAGGLWRDEAQSATVIGLPKVSDVWATLSNDSFPILWYLLLRVWNVVGLGTDAGFRLFGSIVGIGILGALWGSARYLGLSRRPVPLLPLALLALNPVVVFSGDSTRAYGLGLLFAIGIPPTLWKLLRKPSLKHFAIALAVALLSVQTLYFNSVVLFSIGVSAMLLGARDRNWKGAGSVGLTGLLAALSLLFYVNIFGRIALWRPIIQIDFTFHLFLEKLTMALAPFYGNFDLVVWGLLLLAAASLVLFCKRIPRRNVPGGEESLSGDDASLDEFRRGYAIFSFLSFGIGFVAYFLFLKSVSYDFNSWHFIHLLFLLVCAIDSAFLQREIPFFYRARIAIACAVALLWFGPAWQYVFQRHTNVDLIAEKLNQHATAKDYIIVYPFESAVTFNRYYRGAAPWNSIPCVSDHSLQRDDMAKAMMMQKNPIEAIRPVVEKAASTLRAGGNLWIVGSLVWVSPDMPYLNLPPAPHSKFGWWNYPYLIMWSQQVSLVLQRHATEYKKVEVLTPCPVFYYETSPLFRTRGWEP